MGVIGREVGRVFVVVDDRQIDKEAEHAGADEVPDATGSEEVQRPDRPTEQESYELYADVAAAIGDRELNIRLADFGAEKCPSYAYIPVNRNPSLGIRGVRLLLSRDDILGPQVRAIEQLHATAKSPSCFPWSTRSTR